jgi:uncharacterized protein YutD
LFSEYNLEKSPQGESVENIAKINISNVYDSFDQFTIVAEFTNILGKEGYVLSCLG